MKQVLGTQICFLQPLGIQPWKRLDDEEQPLIRTLVVQGIMNILHCHNIPFFDIIHIISYH